MSDNPARRAAQTATQVATQAAAQVATQFAAAWAARDLFDRGGPVRLRVISLHNHVINLQADERGHMLMLADPEMYRGPASAGLDMMDFRIIQGSLKPGDSACFRDEGIEFYGGSDIRVSLSAAEKVSFAVPHNVDFDAGALEADSTKAALRDLAAPHLCSCLLAESAGGSHGGGADGRPGGADSRPADPFAETLTQEFPRLTRSLALGDQAGFEQACSALVGFGYGSTPTGDDLIHGALVALHYLRRITQSLEPIPILPRSLGAKTTLLGAHMLEMAARGLTPEPVQYFASSLLSGKTIEPAFEGLRRMGSDSGPSVAVGFYLMALKITCPC